MKSLAPFYLFFVGVLILVWLIGNSDPITAAVVDARAETSAGPVAMNVIDQSLAFVLKLIGGVTITSILVFLATEGSKWYRRYWFEQNTQRYRQKPGRGQAAPQQQQRSSVPRISRDDVLMALLGLRAPKMQRKQEVTDEFNLDL